MTELFYSIDSLVVRDNVLFGFGWIFHGEYEIISLKFRLSFNVGQTEAYECIHADINKPRADVGEYLKNHTGAVNSGFVVFGAFQHDTPLQLIRMICTLSDGTIIEQPVSEKNIIRLSNNCDAFKSSLALRQLYYFFKRGMKLLRSGKLSSLFEKIQRYQLRKPDGILSRPSDLKQILTNNENSNLCFILDHDLGGGANHYRDRLVQSIIDKGRGVIILSYRVISLSHILIIRTPRLNMRFIVPGTSFLLAATKHLKFSEIIYNTAVSFAHPEEIPQLLISLKKQHNAHLKVLAHDFYPVCPSHFLIDYTGQHCFLPNQASCRACLKRNAQPFASLFTGGDIDLWRSLWGSLLLSSDEIVTFSNNTAKIYQHAYPQLDAARISIVPHKVEYLKGKPPEITSTAELCLGVVGQIGFHKGSSFIQALAREIRRRQLGVKIVVIGSIEASCDAVIVSQTGPYQHAELPRLIEKSGANIMLFPSIWPETFSYVVQELMDMKLPVAAFNLGAPAERLLSYSRSLLLDSMDPRRVLDDLIAFHHKIYLTR